MFQWNSLLFYLFICACVLPCRFALAAEETPEKDSDDDTARVECVGSFGESIDKERCPFVFAGHTLFLGQGFTLRAIDLTDPSHPKEIGHLRIAGEIQSMELYGHALYLGTHADYNAVKIIDVTDPGRMRLRSVLPIENASGASVYLMGHFLDVSIGRYYNYWSIYDLRNPFKPVEIGGGMFHHWNGFITDGSRYFEMRKESYDDGNLNVSLFEQTHRPKKITSHIFPSTIDESESFTQVCKAWLLESVDRFTSGTISTKSTRGSELIWTRIGGELDFVETTARPPKTNNAPLIFKFTERGVEIFDASGDKPKPVGLYPTLPMLNALNVVADKAYADDESGGFHIFDYSTPARPKLIASHKIPHEISYFDVCGRLAYVVCAEPGDNRHANELLVLDLDRPTSSVLFQTRLPHAIFGIAATPNRLYLAAGSAGLQIFDTTDPRAPRQTGSFPAQPCMDVLTSGPLVYTVPDFCVIDATDPSKPILLGRTQIRNHQPFSENENYRITARQLGHYIFMLAPAIYTIDVSDPGHPQIVYDQRDHFNDPDHDSIQRAPRPGPYPDWYLALPTGFHNSSRDGAGSMIYDVSDPRRPVLVGSYWRLHANDQVALAKNLIPLADWQGGMVVLKPDPLRDRRRRYEK